jgi:hypothetical protein
MDTAQQQRVRAIFDVAAEMPEAGRQEYVTREAAGDPAVISSVLRLLRAARSSDRFLENPLAQRADHNRLLGLALGPYRIERYLGAGGMGVVYRAVRADDVYKRTVALKVIRPEFKAREMIERFEHERELLARLDHPNIARIVDGGAMPDGRPYFVMDLVEGLPIDQFSNQRRASLQQRLNLFRQAAMAVQYLHENGVVHCDLKPQNMLVTASGQVKLLDFGIARLVGPGEAPDSGATAIASPGYASPEQLANRPTSAASDVYSLAAILHELLTGLRPQVEFEAGGSLRLPSECLRNAPGPESRDSALQLRRALRGDLDAILLKALAADEADRYASVAEMAADVEAFQGRRAVAARGHRAVFTVVRTVQRNRRIAAALVALVIALSWLGRDEWQLHQLKAQMAAPAGNPAALLATLKGREELVRHVRQVGANYRTVFPKVLDNPLATEAAKKEIVNSNIEWLDKVAPLAEAQPLVATELGRTYLTIAESEWSNDHASLKDASAAMATIQKAVGALKLLQGDAVNDPHVQQIAQEIAREAAQLPAAQ